MACSDVLLENCKMFSKHTHEMNGDTDDADDGSLLSVHDLASNDEEMQSTSGTSLSSTCIGSLLNFGNTNIKTTFNTSFIETLKKNIRLLKGPRACIFMMMQETDTLISGLESALSISDTMSPRLTKPWQPRPTVQPPAGSPSWRAKLESRNRCCVPTTEEFPGPQASDRSQRQFAFDSAPVTREA